MSDVPEVARTFTDSQLLSLYAAHQWMRGYVAGKGEEMPRSVMYAIAMFTPPTLHFEEDSNAK